MVTDAVFGNASPLMEPTRVKARTKLLPHLEQGLLPVITGFNGATADGRPTTLGRGGSDFSASILAAALDAAELWIWTDVDGIMSADPRLVPDAQVLDEITYAEAAELAYNGAKVLHPRTLAPLVEKKIPVWSKNSFAPEKPGTRIVPSMAVPQGARAVTSMRNVALVSLEPASAELNGAQVMARALDAIARANVEVLVVSSSSYRQNFCFLVREDELERSLQALEAALALELAHDYLQPIQVDRNVGLLAAVGEGMQGKPGLAGRIFTRDFARAGEHHRHRPGLERADHRRGGAPRRLGKGRESRACRVRVRNAPARAGFPVRPIRRPGASRQTIENKDLPPVRENSPHFRYTGISPFSIGVLHYMFDLFRSRDKAVRILLGGLLVLVAFSMLTYLVPNYNNGSTGSDTVVAEIGKDTITLAETQRLIQATVRGRQLPTEILPTYIPQMVDQMVTERAMAMEAERLGLQVTDAEVADAIRQMVPNLFPDGKFVGKEAYAAHAGAAEHDDRPVRERPAAPDG